MTIAFLGSEMISFSFYFQSIQYTFFIILLSHLYMYLATEGLNDFLCYFLILSLNVSVQSLKRFFFLLLSYYFVF